MFSVFTRHGALSVKTHSKKLLKSSTINFFRIEQIHNSKMESKEFKVPVPWGHIAGKLIVPRFSFYCYFYLQK
jgi:hypothetical protein